MIASQQSMPSLTLPGFLFLFFPSLGGGGFDIYRDDRCCVPVYSFFPLDIREIFSFSLSFLFIGPANFALTDVLRLIDAARE